MPRNSKFRIQDPQTLQRSRPAGIGINLKVLLLIILTLTLNVHGSGLSIGCQRDATKSLDFIKCATGHSDIGSLGHKMCSRGH